MGKCKQCQSTFEVTDADRAFYDQLSPIIAGKKYPIPEPALCPNCRQQRRLCFRNETSMYHRNCDLCERSMITVYSPDKNLTVYCPKCFWGDDWNPNDYGQNYDLNRSFFEQFAELLTRTPLLSNAVFNAENCEFNSFCTTSKNCYHSYRIGNSEDIYYCYLTLYSKNCMDSYNLVKSEICYECIDCSNCYQCFFSQELRNCSDCYFCYDLTGCKNCFGSVGLRNKEYYFFNKPCSKEEYEKYMDEYFFKNQGNLKAIEKRFFGEERLKYPLRDAMIINSENVIGNHIIESKNIYHAYDVEKTDECRYSWGVEYAKNISDSNFIYYGEHCHENIANSQSQNILFSFGTLTDCHDLMYCLMNFNNTGNCFGSISLKHGQYSILNKQYSKEEYETLVPKIIEKMIEDKEWGEFFPHSVSPFGYNETVAQDYFSLSQQEVIAHGWNWHEKDKKDYQPQTYSFPTSIDQVTDDILKEMLGCKDCGRNYRIIKKELAFYRSHSLMIPELCPLCRHAARIARRTPNQLWERTCDKCNTKIQTSYSPERPEKVYCEECHLSSLY